MGDPAGVGPELCLRLLSDRSVAGICRPRVFGSAAVLAAAAAQCGLEVPADAVSLKEWEDGADPAGPAVIDVSWADAAHLQPGVVSASCGRHAAACIRLAAAAALAGRVRAIVTAPIHKAALSLAGERFAGHTEMLAQLSGAGRVCMMMASEELAVALVTTHVAISEVPALLDSESVAAAIRLLRDALLRMKGREPVICVLSLNPHGGEGGLFGDEERRVIGPAIAAARGSGWRVDGPVPPDTAFLPDRRARYDGYVVMYHDQGLIPFKMLAFESGVNVTLGLPFVRTSPDHGTAFDIAWTGRASPESMVQAALLAVRLGALR
ncbi:MAG: 4-hydroxythreonine-4-phosphate dehydrogenase PdxA [Lentisphaerae bacterium]|nr:4-hydroxythreonine-4-phosphate dehydrogenase PdxA [Lentisphaerota bacterium]